MKTTFRILFLSFLMGVAPTFFVGVSAQEAEEQSAPAITQGELALVLVQKLGLNVGVSQPLSEMSAMALLTTEGVTPFGGWVKDKAVTPGDLARMIVQALDALDEIDDAEEDNPETTAYFDFLKRKYNLDIQSANPAYANVARNQTNGSVAGEFGDNASSDPLQNRGAEGELDDLDAGGNSSGIPSFVNANEVNRVLAQLTPTQGGGNTGQVDPGAANATPSAPNP
jgi:hypothetical protein